MFFGDTVLVEDNGGLSTPENAGKDRKHPDYEYSMVTVSMESNSVNAVTHCGISDYNIPDEPLEKGDYKYHKSLFDKSFSYSRVIMADIEPSSISDRIYCLSKAGNELNAISPSSISLYIREINNNDSQDIYGGRFHFDDEKIEREYSIETGNNSLSISIPLNHQSFSKIFDSIKSGDKSIGLTISFPAYAFWIDKMAGIWAPSSYIIDSDDDKRNFVMISKISSSLLGASKKEEEEDESMDYEIDDKEPSVTANEINESINSLIAQNRESRVIMKTISTGVSIITACAIAIAVKIIF
ncbi:hypothetical protein AO825_08210 [Pectobacterium brasiliense]|uniref:hypothetical protein n=1 Tax=Pectobacterium brasiliense TaxID=180957 RepID=UPI0001A4273B|nr:hypothetical protein [Pectobacterium brasiliense]KGA24897.1 hypothetical protein KS44_06180 [Pectobacterium brasiliense]KRF62833.1 hypothetical protein AO825_08210 [Pectobacterium brasiliense]MBN3186042.1 hypothetical protein [Pectobacterium brasiliense]QHG26874.1 hypothetical protein GT391_01750 [Pectobacterium brasiliense]